MTVEQVTDTWSVSFDEVPVGISAVSGVVVVCTAEGRAYAFDVASGKKKCEVAFEDGLLGTAVQPSGRSAVLFGPFGAWLWSLEDESVTELAPHSWCAQGMWANDDRFALAVGREVQTFDAQGKQLWRSEQLPSTVTDVIWLGGRHRLAAAVYGGVHVMEPRPRGTVTHLPFTGSLLALAATPNGKWIVSGNQDASLQVFKPDDDTRLEMQGYPNKIALVDFDSSGNWLANNGSGEVSVWDFRGTGPRGRSPVLCISRDPEAKPRCFAWHPEKPVLAIGWDSGEVAVFRVSQGLPGKPFGGKTLVSSSGNPVESLCFAGQGLVFAQHDGTLRRVEVPLLESS